MQLLLHTAGSSESQGGPGGMAVPLNWEETDYAPGHLNHPTAKGGAGRRHGSGSSVSLWVKSPLLLSEAAPSEGLCLLSGLTQFL